MSEHDFAAYSSTAELLKALGHPVRLCIVRGLLQKEHCNVTYMQDCLDLPQSTVSQHLQKLRSAGIVKAERKGLEIYYTIADERVKRLVTLLLPEEDKIYG